MDRFNLTQMYCLSDLYFEILFENKIKRIQLIPS